MTVFIISKGMTNIIVALRGNVKLYSCQDQRETQLNAMLDQRSASCQYDRDLNQVLSDYVAVTKSGKDGVWDLSYLISRRNLRNRGDRTHRICTHHTACSSRRACLAA